jgi:hypothetical protein
MSSARFKVEGEEDLDAAFSYALLPDDSGDDHGCDDPKLAFFAKNEEQELRLSFYWQTPWISACPKNPQYWEIPRAPPSASKTDAWRIARLTVFIASLVCMGYWQERNDVSIEPFSPALWVPFVLVLVGLVDCYVSCVAAIFWLAIAESGGSYAVLPDSDDRDDGEREPKLALVAEEELRLNVYSQFWWMSRCPNHPRYCKAPAPSSFAPFSSSTSTHAQPSLTVFHTGLVYTAYVQARKKAMESRA